MIPTRPGRGDKHLIHRVCLKVWVHREPYLTAILAYGGDQDIQAVLADLLRLFHPAVVHALIGLDVGNVVFKECAPEFTIRDKFIYIGDINMKSDLLDINGPMRIGFDGTIKSTLKAEFSESSKASGASNARVTLGRCSLIDVTGSLKDPQYKIRPDVQNIVECITEHFFSE